MNQVRDDQWSYSFLMPAAETRYSAALSVLRACSSVTLSLLKGFRDVMTAVIFVVLLAAFFSKGIRNEIGKFFASHYGLQAYAYYEVDKSGQLTRLGRLYLLRGGGRHFTQLRVGDRLMAADGVNLRNEAKRIENNRLMVLQGGQCVVILKIGDPVEQIINVGGSGGWLLVGTAPCELFERPKPFF
jgi:hypothetical protein